jgi:hypothetical protein
MEGPRQQRITQALNNQFKPKHLGKHLRIRRESEILENRSVIARRYEGKYWDY